MQRRGVGRTGFVRFTTQIESESYAHHSIIVCVDVFTKPAHAYAILLCYWTYHNIYFENNTALYVLMYGQVRKILVIRTGKLLVETLTQHGIKLIM